jgi:hypothetical protein
LKIEEGGILGLRNWGIQEFRNSGIEGILSVIESHRFGRVSLNVYQDNPADPDRFQFAMVRLKF